MQLEIDKTYIDDLNIKWTIIHKLPSGVFVGYSHELPDERVRKFAPSGKIISFYAHTQLREIEQEWFGVEITIDGGRKLVNGTWKDKEEAITHATESWWKYKPRVVRLRAEEIK